jgi:hypothetical protein
MKSNVGLKTSWVLLPSVLYVPSEVTGMKSKTRRLSEDDKVNLHVILIHFACCIGKFLLLLERRLWGDSCLWMIVCWLGIYIQVGINVIY